MCHGVENISLGCGVQASLMPFFMILQTKMASGGNPEIKQEPMSESDQVSVIFPFSLLW